MNPHLLSLQAYPFERLKRLFAGVTPNNKYSPINLSIGEPKHATPNLIRDTLLFSCSTLANYPTTAGSPELRSALADWLKRRYRLAKLDPETQVLPVLGSREALFAFAQAIVDPSRTGAAVVMTNPFYQIYEGATLLAGALPYYVNHTADNAYVPQWQQLPEQVWQCTQLLYICSPDNPTGRVLGLEQWKELFACSDRYGFIIAADECYAEIYFDEAKPPLGVLDAAQQLGRSDFRRIMSFGSLSKRSNAPGLRSGYVAGDAELIKAFLLYRTYHGSAMSGIVAAASIAAWKDEQHVKENRQKYADKFSALAPQLEAHLPVRRPDAAFYLWAKTPFDDTDFARDLYQQYNVTVLPGSYLGRQAHGQNPGQGFVRIALVAEFAECATAIERLIEFCRKL